MFIKTDETWRRTDIYPFADDERAAALTWRVSVNDEGVILVSGDPLMTPHDSVEVAKKKIAGLQKAVEIAEERQRACASDSIPT